MGGPSRLRKHYALFPATLSPASRHLPSGTPQRPPSRVFVKERRIAPYLLEPSRKTSFRCPASMSPRPRGCTPRRWRPSNQRGTSPPDRLSPHCRALPCTLAPHAHPGLGSEAIRPGATSATPGSPMALPAPEERGGPPCLRGGAAGRAGTGQGLPSQHNQGGEGGLAQVSPGLRSQDPGPCLLFPLWAS